jgi:hypothetical protein
MNTFVRGIDFFAIHFAVDYQCNFPVMSCQKHEIILNNLFQHTLTAKPVFNSASTDDKKLVFKNNAVAGYV